MTLPRIFICLAALLLVASCTSTPVAERDPVSVDEQNPPAIVETFFNSHGETLSGLAYLANGAGPHPTVLLLHGYPGNEKSLDVAQYLRRDGWNVVFFHYRSAWGSEGEFSFVNAAEDVGAALSHIRANAEEFRADPNRIVIVGHSMGGQMAIAGGSNDPEISCIATLAAAPLGPIPDDIANEDATDQYKAYADSLIMLKGHDGSNVIEQDIAFAQAYPIETVAAKLEGRKLFLLAAQNDRAAPISIHHAYVEALSKHPDITLQQKIYKTDHSFSTHRIAISRDITGWLDQNYR